MSASASVKAAPIKMKLTRKERRAAKEVEVLRQQATPILPATTFKRIVTQTAAECTGDRTRLRFNQDAVRALQAAAEHELTTVFTGAAFCASLAKRDTVSVEDMRNFAQIRNL